MLTITTVICALLIGAATAGTFLISFENEKKRRSFIYSGPYDTTGYAPGYGGARAGGSAVSAGAGAYSGYSSGGGGGGHRQAANFASGSIGTDQFGNSRQQMQINSPFPVPFPSFPSPFPAGASPFFPPFQPLQFAPLPPVLTPPQFNEAISTYLNSIQAQYARYEIIEKRKTVYRKVYAINL